MTTESQLIFEAIERCQTNGHLLDWTNKTSELEQVHCRRCGQRWNKIKAGWRKIGVENEIDQEIPSQLPSK